jgi:hypothetical protein
MNFFSLSSIYLLLFFILNLSPQPVNAAGEDPSEQPIQHTVELDIPFSLQKLDATLDGFTDTQVEPPFNLGYAFHLGLGKNHRWALLAKAHLSWIRYELAPIFGIASGMEVSFSKFKIRGSLFFEDQKTIQKTFYSNSPFNILYFGPEVQATLQATPALTFGITARIFLFSSEDTQLAYLEGFSTEIRHEETFVISPEVSFEPFENFETNARLDIYELGATAIASKEFAFGMPTRTVTRWNISATYPLWKFKVRGRYSLVTDIYDPLEIYYQAPFLTQDYLLSKQVAALEILWKF